MAATEGTLGDIWYREFWNQFQVYVATNRPRWNVTTSDKKWSKFVFDFLTYLAEDLGYSEESEEPAFRSKRFDRVWRRDQDTIVIEHENWGIKYALKDEVRKLAQRNGDLHVCITYVPTHEFPGSGYAEECIHVLQGEGFDGEFLLILGSNEMSSPTDWVCHRISTETSLKSETIVLPTTKATIQRRAAPSHERARLESGWQRLKRRYPSSRAASNAIRQAKRRNVSKGYIRVLESVRRHWLRRGK